MTIARDEDCVRVADLAELSARNAPVFRDELRAALPAQPRRVDIDLAATHTIDSSGLGALFAVHRAARHANHSVVFRLLNPRPEMQRIFELTRLHQIFEITRE